MTTTRSINKQMPFCDRVVFFYEAFDGVSARLHANKVGVIDFGYPAMAQACHHFITNRNNAPGLKHIRSTACGKYLALVDITKMKGNLKWKCV